VSSDRVIDVLDADTRAQAQILIGQLRVGTQGRAAPGLRAAVARLGSLVDHGGDVAGALARRRRLLTRLVDELDVIFTTLGQRQDLLVQVVGYGGATLRVSGARRPELEASFRELPGMVDELRRALDALGSLSVPLDPTLARLRPFARQLPAGLRALRTFLPAGRALVKDLGPLTRQVREARSLRAALHELGGAAPGLQASINDLYPVLRAIDRNKNGIGQLGENFSGVFSTNDANGPILRGLGAFEPFDPANLGMAGAQGAQLRRLKRNAADMLDEVCRQENDAACLARFLVPGLPGAVVPVSASPRIVPPRRAP
jgi:phospholipid/cholesterol/gamma-HCH transport system substrate-binding protein